MENLNKKSSFDFVNRLEPLEKILYGALVLLLIFGAINFSGLFSSHEKPISLGGRCGFTIMTNGATFNGYAFDADTGLASKTLKIQLLSIDRKNHFTFSVDSKDLVERPDVAKAFNAPNAVLSGFNVVIPKDLINPGQYHVILEQLTEDGIRVLCNIDGGPDKIVEIK